MSFEIFKLVSGTYSHAAAALINSLQMHDFDGHITVAHSGELNLSLAPDAPVKTIKLDALEKWIGCQKPRLLLNEARGAFALIDADCVVGSPGLLEIIRDTVPTRPLLAVEAILPHCDYRREGWSHCVQSMLGRKSVPVENIYYNSGFITGDVTRDAALLREWEAMVDQLRDTGDLFRDEHFPMADQDCLNAILQDGTVNTSALSPPDIWYAASPVNPFFHVGTGCYSAWNKDPVLGVIGIQKGPPRHGVHTGFLGIGSRGWDAGRGDGCEDPPRIFCRGQADKADLPGATAVAQGGSQGDPVGSDGVPLRARGAAAAEDWPLAGRS